MRRSMKVVLSSGLAFLLILVLFPSILRTQGPGRGNLVGFIYGQDGSTPVEGAVVVVKNLTTGAVSESPKSDRLGVFKIQDLGAGLYALGVKSDKGSYNSQDFFGVTADKTAKITVALNTFDEAAAAAATAVIKEQRDKGEAFVGRVVKYNPQTKEAEVLVEIGLIQAEDRIHIKGQVTDFYQDMRGLKAYGAKAKRVLSGYTALIQTSKSCEPDDFVYIVCKRGVPPFFLAPLGIAAIVAGATPLIAIYEEEPVSDVRVIR
jgi:hypothetical protein